MCILGGTPALLYAHNLVAAEPQQMFEPVQMSASCSSLLGGKTQSRLQGTHGPFRDYYSEEQHIETFRT